MRAPPGQCGVPRAPARPARGSPAAPSAGTPTRSANRPAAEEDQCTPPGPLEPPPSWASLPPLPYMATRSSASTCAPSTKHV
eukprot:1185400-Prorocentrum_minimum.AAC.1